MAVDDRGRYVAATRAALETARSQLEEAEQEHAALQERLKAAISSGDNDAAIAMAGEFAPIVARIEKLRAAVTAAETAEDRRIAEARVKEQRSAVRAAKSHRSNFVRAARELQTAIREVGRTHQRCMDALDAARAVLPAEAAWPRFWWTIGQEIPADVRAALGEDAVGAGQLAPMVDGISAFLSSTIAGMEADLPTEPREDAA